MLPLLQLAASLIEGKQKADQQRQQNIVNAQTAALGGGAPRPQPGSNSGGGALGLLSQLGKLTGTDKPKLESLSVEAKGSDPLSYDSVKALQGIGIGSQGPTREEDLSLLGG